MKTIVVLGSKIFFNPSVGRYQPGKPLKSRLYKAYEIFLNLPESIIVVSGDIVNQSSVSKASIMKEYLIQKGLPFCKIFLENQSVNRFNEIK